MVDRFVTLQASPLADNASATIRYRDSGAGTPVVILHGGWGYAIYPFDRQVAALASRHRVVIPDRTGYGQSGRIDVQHPDFHQRAADETRAFVDALGLERPILWGHSDGAVIALRLALAAPERVRGVIAEATHFHRRKPASRAFFEAMRDSPDQFGERVTTVLQSDHGDRWRALLQTNGRAWLAIGDMSAPTPDLYEGRLPSLRVPTLLIHGARDPRTEPGEWAALCAAIPDARCELLTDGAHSPHSERATADAVTQIVGAWIA